jgi:hypothetical protein
MMIVLIPCSVPKIRSHFQDTVIFYVLGYYPCHLYSRMLKNGNLDSKNSSDIPQRGLGVEDPQQLLYSTFVLLTGRHSE